MKTLTVDNLEGNLKSVYGEILHYRIYSDGCVKIEGLNMRKNFSTIQDANKYINTNNIQIL